MTNLTPSKNDRFVNILKQFIDEVRKKDRGKRCSHSSVDVLFMTLSAYLKIKGGGGGLGGNFGIVI